MGFFKRLFEGNKKTKRSFAEKLKYIFTGNEIDEEFYEELEYCLISSDIGAIKNLGNKKKNFFYVENKSGQYVIDCSEIFIIERRKRKLLVMGENG